MLQSFLWLFSMKFGAYLIAVSSVSLSCGLLLTDVNFLQHLGMSQGNVGFVAVYFLSSLVLLVGVYQENPKMLTPWMIVSMTGTIESFVASSIIKDFNKTFCISIVIDVFFWFCIRTVYAKLKRKSSSQSLTANPN